MAKLTKTPTPGIFRRHKQGCSGRGRCECSYVVIWRRRGRQSTESFRTLAEAREAKREREAGAVRREGAEARRVALHAFAREWVERYQGKEQLADAERRLAEAEKGSGAQSKARKDRDRAEAFLAIAQG